MSWPITRKLKMTTILVQKIRFICFNLMLSPVEIAIILLSITLSAGHIPITMYLDFWSGLLLKRLDLAEFLASELFFMFWFSCIYRLTDVRLKTYFGWIFEHLSITAFIPFTEEYLSLNFLPDCLIYFGNCSFLLLDSWCL